MAITRRSAPRAWTYVRILPLVAPLFAIATSGARAATEVRRGEMSGYLLFDGERVPKEFNAGFSLYAAAWPLVDHYPGHDFQTGLLSTWMHPLYEPGQKPKEECYIDIEGGLGWWRDTHFPTTTPKFIMGGVGPNFSVIANGPGYGAGTWQDERGLYGVAQLSPWLLFPLDGLNLKQGAQGELFGYGYLPLPLTDPKPTTGGTNVPTGNQCWTLFLNTANFKGPAAFFTPYFWSRALIKNPQWTGKLLDSAPSDPNKAIQMETQHIPAVFATNHDGTAFARLAQTSFPLTPEGHSAMLHRHTVYTKAALWDDVERWFAGGSAADGLIKTTASTTQRFKATGGSSWRFFPPGTPRKEAASLAWKSFATPITPDPLTLGFRWNETLTRRNDSLVTLPEFFRLGREGDKPRWVVTAAREVPDELGLTQYRFETPKEKPQKPRTTPDAAESSWKKPGPVAGPFKARLGDGSVLTYYWYRFADQPAMLNADLTAAEREIVQKRVEKLHRAWTKDREYLAPPDGGRLAAIDPALVVTPPKGLEVGYVPIATRQELESPAAILRETRGISGWQVHIQKQLIESEPAATERALTGLKTMLDEIVRVVPAPAVAELQKVPLYFSPAYRPGRSGAEFHPDAGWLRANGRDPAMARAVEFSGVGDFEAEMKRMPNFALHELAHAYHHRALKGGFDNVGIKAAYEHAKATGKYARVERSFGNGKPNTFEKAYAMTDPMEYFAESTEAFFSRNDFFPFTRDQLKQHDPEIHDLLIQLWGVPEGK